ncbi:unnamed protein product [Rotaria sp. Silwood2]|nr:unnamed protein product [Rotaria sp. Silwood2]
MRTAVIKLWQDGKSKKFISRVVNHDIKTIRKIIKSYEQEVAGKLQESTKVTILSNYQDQIQQFLEQNLSKVRIFEELQKAGYNGSYPSLTNYARGLEVSGKVCVRFHTLAGEEAQVDFGEVLFTTTAEILRQLHMSKADNSYYKKFNEYLAVDLLILDELGFKKLPNYSSDDFFEIIAKRYEKGSVIITSNKPFENWGEIFDDKVLANAIRDRVIHHAIICKINNGISYRTKSISFEPNN